jgi:hypothetical protein
VDVRTGTIPKLAEALERIAAERGVAAVDVVDVLFVD